MEQALISIIETIQSSGGLLEFSDGLVAPSADPTWTDLGHDILNAHGALKKDGIDIPLSIETVDYCSKDAD